MASQDTESIEMNDSLPDDGGDSTVSPTGPHYKSFKRKFGKQKIKFEHAMKEGNSLVKEEMRIQDLSKRLKEQNDQLLELLLELNNTIHVPPHYRYTLDVEDDVLQRLDSPDPDAPKTIHCDANTARERLNEAKERLIAGELSAESCRDLEQSMLNGQTFAPTNQFSNLLKVPHTAASDTDPDSVESELDYVLGFLSPEEELEYSRQLDNHQANGNGRSTTSSPDIDKDKKAALRNPVSAYNWLRKHQPQVFSSDSELPPEKPQPPARSGNVRSSKRAAPQKDEDVYDDDGILLDAPEPATVEKSGGAGGSRSKRKREEDGMYHPKSGAGSRSKRKRDDSSRRAKRASAASAAA